MLECSTPGPAFEDAFESASEEGEEYEWNRVDVLVCVSCSRCCAFWACFQTALLARPGPRMPSGGLNQMLSAPTGQLGARSLAELMQSTSVVLPCRRSMPSICRVGVFEDSQLVSVSWRRWTDPARSGLVCEPQKVHQDQGQTAIEYRQRLDRPSFSYHALLLFVPCFLALCSMLE